MPDLTFHIDRAEADLGAAAPLLTFGLRIVNADPAERIESIVLRCQIQIEATRRRYDSREQARLVDLFGEPDRWSKTLNRMLWTHAATVVGPFTGETTVDLPVPCTFDFNIAATKYFAGLDDGETPLLLQFSGTIFYLSDTGLQVAIIPWDRETRFRLPVAVWRQMMDAHYPNSAWLRLRKDAFDRLHAYKSSSGLATWEQAIDRLLATAAEAEASHGASALRETFDADQVSAEPREHPTMTIDPVEKIANAVLYEGYILYPYRAGAVKNRQRFNFGSLYPAPHCQAQSGADSDTMQIECLVSCDERVPAAVEARVRFLHLQSREVFRRTSAAGSLDESSGPATSAGELAYELVDLLAVDGRLHQTWQEAVERDIIVSCLSLAELANRPTIKNFLLPGSTLHEELTDAGGHVVGRVVRREHDVVGVLALSAERLAPDMFKLRLVINNVSPLADTAVSSRDELLLSTFISTHAILRVTDGEFVSLLEPPDALRDAAAACRNVGAWPVLAGEPGRRDRLLASPIILYDYPQVAPESSGDWCDGAEIDEMLVLRVMTLTGDEKQAMRDVDRRAREILERAESLTEEQMLKLHGAFRGLDRRAAALSSEEATP